MAKGKGSGNPLARGRVRARTPLAATTPRVARTVPIPGALAVPAGRRVIGPPPAASIGPPGPPPAPVGSRRQAMAAVKAGKAMF